MPLLRSRVASVLRLLRVIGVPERRHRIPRQQQPDLVRAEYLKAILPFLRPALDAFAQVRGEVLRLLSEEGRERGPDRMDSLRGDAAKDLLRRAGERAAAAFEPHALREVVAKFGRRASDFQKTQLDRQVRAAMGVPLSTIEAPVVSRVEEFAAQNVELIRTVSERYFDRIRLDVEDAFESGMHPSTLAEKFVERDGMAEDDAKRIARDQIGKLNGQVNQARQEALGVEGYVWRGVQDNRERDNHSELEGEECSWDDPPMGGGTTEDEPGHPGSGICCRCYGEPVFTPILEEAD